MSVLSPPTWSLGQGTGIWLTFQAYLHVHVVVDHTDIILVSYAIFHLFSLRPRITSQTELNV